MIPYSPEVHSNEEVLDKVREVYGVSPEHTREYWESVYPDRNLPEGAEVTRIAPSPTGFMHIGSIYTAMACEKLAKDSGGLFFVRIEDTDQKREVPGAIEGILSSLDEFGIHPSEGTNIGGEYGPYIQTERGLIYRSLALELLAADRAYICFATPEEIGEANRIQKERKEAYGYYGEYSIWRNKSEEEVSAELEKGTPFVIRYKNNVNPGDRVVVHDKVKGLTAMDDNFNDSVIIKADGLPTYHFAHVVDDHFMGTTHVIRGTEWFPSTPLHMQLFREMGWKLPIYSHVATIDKIDPVEGGVRKLSKRKDPEARAGYYTEAGYMPEAVQSYLLNLLDSEFEDWRAQNPTAKISEYKFSRKALAKESGALFDFEKLKSIGRNEIAKLTAEEVYSNVLTWAEKYGYSDISEALSDREYALQVFGLERGGEKPRKDIACWEDIRSELGYFFPQIFAGFDPEVLKSELGGFDALTISNVVEIISGAYKADMSLEEWQNFMKDIAVENGFTTDKKAYKANPELYKGFWGEVPKIIRIMIAGRNKSPDLYSVMKKMGEERLKSRFAKGLEAIKSLNSQ